MEMAALLFSLDIEEVQEGLDKFLPQKSECFINTLTLVLNRLHGILSSRA